MTADLESAKAALRQSILTRRKGIPPAVRRQRDAALVAHLVDHLARDPVSQLFLYWPVRGEPDLTGVAPLMAGLVLGLPVVSESRGLMDFRRWRPGEAMHPNRYRIPEPVAGETLKPDGGTLVLIPAVAVDRHGVRLGYGGGYYDRWLHRESARSVLVTYEEFVLDSLPRAAHDQVGDLILTETGLRRGQTDPPGQ